MIKHILLLVILGFSVFSFGQTSVNNLSFEEYENYLDLFSLEEIEDSLELVDFFEDNEINDPYQKQLLYANYHYRKNNYFEAIDVYYSILNNKDQQFNSYIKAWCLKKLAEVCYLVQAPGVSIRFQKQILQEQPNYVQPYIFHHDIALYYYNNNDIDSAIYHFEKSKEFAASNSEKIQINNNMSNTLLLEKKYPDAYRHLKENLAFPANTLSYNDSVNITRSYSLIADYHYSQGNYEKAKLYLEEILSWRLTRSIPEYEYYYLTQLVEVYEKLGNSKVPDLIKQLRTSRIHDIASKKEKYRLEELYLRYLNKNGSVDQRAKQMDTLAILHTALVEKVDSKTKELKNNYNSTLIRNLELQDTDKSVGQATYAFGETHWYSSPWIFYSILGFLILLVIYLALRISSSSKREEKRMYRLKSDIQDSDLRIKEMEILLASEQTKRKQNDINHMQDLIHVKNKILDEVNEQLQDSKRNFDTQGKREISKLIRSMRKGTEEETVQEVEELSAGTQQSTSELYYQLKKKFPKLSDAELKLCSLMRLGYDTKSIAKIRNIGTDSIRTFKYRIKKKLEIEGDILVDEYLRNVKL